MAGYSDKDERATPGGYSPNDAPAPKPAGVIRRLADMTAVPFAQGVVGVPEIAVGAADLISGGRAGKAAEEIGFRPREAKQIIGDALYSDEQKAANEAVAKADGFLPTLGEIAKNPSTAVRTAVESVPGMLASGVVGRGVMALGARGVAAEAGGVGPSVPGVITRMAGGDVRAGNIAGGIGEGVVSGAQNAEQVRQESPTGLLTPEQSALLAGSGAVTGVIGGIANRFAARAGIGDADTGLVLGRMATDAAGKAAVKGPIRKMAEGFVREGLLEETPQSAQEQIAQNLAQGKPWDEGVGNAAATGLAAGGVTGAAVGPFGHSPAPPAPAAPVAPPPFFGPMSHAARLLPAPDSPPAAPIAVDTEGNAGTLAQHDLAQRERESATIVEKRRARNAEAVDVEPRMPAGPLSSAIDVAPEGETNPEPAETNAAPGETLAPAEPLEAALPETPSEGYAPGDIVVDQHFDAIHAGATSPTNDRAEPSERQKHAENYKVGRTRVGGMSVSVENAQGSERKGVDADGKPWSTTMTAHYGRLLGTKGADSTPEKPQHLDVFVKPGTPAGRNWNGPVFVVDQVDPKTGAFDEHKAIFGASDEADAERLYRSNYDAGWNGIGSVTRMEQPDFKRWAYDGTVKSQPVGRLERWQAAAPDLQGSPAGSASAPVAPGTDGALPPEPDAAAGAAVEPLTRAAAVERGPAVVLQNRDRSSAASIAQMNEIAAAPDYLRAGPARVMETGAPVAFGDLPPTAVQGRSEPIADGKGQRVTIRYAVVEADDLIASNRADGSAVPEYAQGVAGKLRAVAGNGRAAGIAEAYQRGTAGTYRDDLVADAQALGLDPAALQGMRAPVLVRVMDAKDVSPDIGDRSNIAGTARLSPVEQAATDARRIDLAALEFDASGEPSAEAVRQFVSGMPMAERGEMLNRDGTPTRQAIDRLMAATFKEAYGSDELVRLYAQAVDPEARTVMAALADAAGAMAALKDAGELDIRGAVAEAAGFAVNARRKGKKLADELKTVDMTMSGEAFEVARFIADNVRSAKRIAEGLRAWANYAAQQTQIARDNEVQGGMFGSTPTASRADLFKKVGNEQQEDAAEEDRAVESAGQAVAGDRAARRQDDAAAGRAGAAPGRDAGEEVAPGDSVGESQPAYAASHETDLFGNPVPRQQSLPDSGSTGPARPRPDSGGLFGNAQPEPDVSPEPAAAAPDSGAAAGGDAAADTPGKYFVDTFLVSPVTRELGAARIRTAADLARATRYLYRSAVERFDAIVTDKDGTPLAVVGGFKGAVTQTSVYPATVVAEAIRIPGAAHIWFSHNHPSGHSRLSDADMRLNNTMYDTFKGSGIAPMGTMAVSRDKFSFVSGRSDFASEQEQQIAYSREKLSVPVYERELRDERNAPMAITSPDNAKKIATTFYDHEKGPGVLFMDAQMQVAAWLPIEGSLRGLLRDTGGFATMLKAASRSNANSAIIVHGGELDAPISARYPSVVLNLAGAMRAVDIRTMDIINTKTQESTATRGLQLASDTFFSRKAPPQDLLTTYDKTEAAAKQEREAAAREAEEKERNAKPAAGKKVTADQVDLFNPQSTLFRRGDTKVGHEQRITAIHQLVSRLSAKWTRRPDIHVIDSMDDAPDPVRREWERQNSQGAAGAIEGFHYRGGVYLVAEALETPQDVRRVLYHEALGHFGLRGVFGQALKPILTQLADGRPELIERKAQQYGLDLSKESDRLMAAEEVLAELAQTKPKLGIVQRAIAAIRRFLRRAGFDLQMSDSDIVAMYLLPARGWVERGRSQLPTSVTNPAFQRVFHGTPHEVDKFSTDKIGTGEGVQAYGWGLYFAGRREVAEHYRDKLAGSVGPGSKRASDSAYVNAARSMYQSGMKPEEILPALKSAYKQATEEDLRLAMHEGNPGRVYEVEIPEEGEYLLWDRPLSDQPPKVKAALREFIVAEELTKYKLALRGATPAETSVTGESFYRFLAEDMLKGKPEASGELRAIGIRGIKYLDGDSRTRTLREVKKEFLSELPQDAEFDEVMDLIGSGTFSPQNEAILKALQADDWLGFDYPAQAISAALGGQLSDFDASPALLQAVADAQDGGTYNYVVFDDKDVEIKAAFSRGPAIAGNTGRYTQAQLDAMRRVGFAVDPVPLKDRVKAIMANAGKRLAQGIADQFAPIREISQDAYSLLRLSKGASGAFNTMLHGGLLKLSSGVYDFDEQHRGGVLDRLLIPLQGEHHDFLRWVAANRAEQLATEDREHLFTPADIAALKTLASGQLGFDFTLRHGAGAGTVTRDRAAAYRDSLATFNEFNKNTLDMAEQSGLIDGPSRPLWEKMFYVPFYRVEGDAGLRGMNIKSGVIRQQAFKQLKGGSQQLNADLLENTLQNWAHLLDAAAKNRAAKATLEAMGNVGAAVETDEATARQMAKSMGSRDGVVWFADGGTKRYFLIDDPHLLAAVSALEYAGMNSPVMKALGAFKHFLTIGVTASPFFKVRNLLRDTMQVAGTSPISANLLGNLAQGWKATRGGSDDYYRLLAGGGTIHFGSMLEGSEAKRVQSLVNKGVDPANILDSGDKVRAFYNKTIEPVITAYNELGNRGEAINRAALYQQLRAQGVSHRDASLQARDLMDFSMQGSFTTVRFLTQVVPFMNARIQGLYKLGKAAGEDPARFSIVLGATAMVSIALMAAYSDDDDWKQREDWDRNNFWWFKFGGTAIRIPKPFEIGAIATLAERSFEYAFDKEMTGKRFRENVVALLGDNLSMNPIPQLVKPALDVYANKDSFTERPIETMGMEKLKPDFRFTERTTMAARAASTALNAAAGVVGAQGPSPVQIDHLVRGYFGWLGQMVVTAGDVAARPATGQPTRPAPDYWKSLTGAMVAGLEGAQSRYVSEAYKQAKEIEQVYGTYRHLVRQGQVQEAQAFREENAAELARYHRLEGVKRALTLINQLQRQVESGPGTPDEKRSRIDELARRRDTVARQLAPS